MAQALREKQTLLMVLTAALFLRVWGLSYGLYHADEPIVVNHALAYGLGDFNPHFFKIPPLASYLLFGFYGIFYAAGRVAGFFGGIEAFQSLYVRNPLVFYMMARMLLGVLPGFLAVYFLYKRTREAFSPAIALSAALLLAVNFLHARDSHYAYADMWMVWAALMAVFAAHSAHREVSWKRYAFAGAWIGLAAAFKYNAVLAAFPLATAFLLNKQRKLRYLLGAGVVSAAVFAALNPFAVLSFGEFRAELLHQSGAENRVGFWHPVAYSLAGAGGWPWILAALAGFALWGRENKKTLAMFLSFVAAYYLHLVFFSQTHERYALPLVPFFCLGAAIAVENLKGLKKAVLLMALVVFPLAKTIQADMLFSRPDTRDVAKVWFEKNVPAGASVAFGHSFYRPPLQRAPEQIAELEAAAKDAPENVRIKIASFRKFSDPSRPGYRLFFLSGSSSEPFSGVYPLRSYNAAALAGEKIAYLVLHYASGAFRPDFEAAALEYYPVVKRFSPYFDRKKKYSNDDFAVTCGAYGWKELFSRKSFGPVLEIGERGAHE